VTYQTFSSKVTAYAVVAALLIGAALAVRQPQLVALASPFAVALVVSLLLTRRLDVTVTVDVDVDRAMEGDELVMTATVFTNVAVERLELMWPLPDGLAYGDDVVMPHAVRTAAGTPRELRYPFRAERWGVYQIGGVVVRARGPLGLTTTERRFPPSHVLRVYPVTEALRRLARPVEATLTVGTLLSRHKGDGFDFADLRSFVPGDRVRNVNWRATARRGELRVNERHPERSTDVVVLVDAFDNLALPVAVRAAVSLAAAYLRQRDRVAVVSFGGTLHWLQLGLGDRQLYRIIDALIESATFYSYAWKGLDVVPRQALPANAMLVAVSPLTDRRTIVALLDRAARGTDVAVVQVSLEPYAAPGTSDTERLGYLMWQHEVDRVADRLRERGIPVVPWRAGEPLDATLEEVAAFQRYTRHRVG
jgi:uncharacterized protein (DUF58 family)